MSEIDKLLEVMQALRDPDKGCSWDVQQDFSSIAPYTLGEAYEVADAIARSDMPALKDELGDLLFQVVFHSQMASEAGLFKDALSLYDFARARHAEISVIGRSLGGGVAAYLASKRDVHKLVLVTPFDSALNMARELYPLFPVTLLLKDRYDTAGRAGKITAPVLAIIAGQDGIIPRSRSDALVDAFPAGQITVAVIENAGHNTIDDSAGYAEALMAFLNE